MLPLEVVLTVRSRGLSSLIPSKYLGFKSTNVFSSSSYKAILACRPVLELFPLLELVCTRTGIGAPSILSPLLRYSPSDQEKTSKVMCLYILSPVKFKRQRQYSQHNATKQNSTCIFNFTLWSRLHQLFSCAL